MALVSLSDYKTFEKITGTSEDTRLQMILDAAESWIENYCGRDFEQGSKTETHSGGASTIRLLSAPVNSLTSISVLSSSGVVSGTIALTSVMYDASTGIISTIGPVVAPSYSDCLMDLGTVYESPIFPPGFRNIQVVYNGGYASGSIPDDLHFAVFAVADWLKANAGSSVTYQSESIGAYSYTKGDGSLAPQHITRLLDSYRMY